MKRLLSLALVLVMVAGALPTFAPPALAAEYTGTCGADGDNVTWTLDTDTGLLEISGEGDMEEYNVFVRPSWYSHVESIKSVRIHDGVTSLGAWTFVWHLALTDVVIGDSVTRIGDKAFEWDCDSITNLVIGNSVEYIGAEAFRQCQLLTSVVIPDSVTYIGNSAFYACTSLTNLIIGDSVEHIGDWAFFGLQLTDLNIPESVTYIGKSAFGNCARMTDIYVAADNPSYASENGVLFNKNKTILIQYPMMKTDTSYTVPDSVTEIGYYAFSCESLRSVVIGKKVAVIGASAFWGCNDLYDIYFESSFPPVVVADAFGGVKDGARAIVGSSVYGPEGSEWNDLIVTYAAPRTVVDSGSFGEQGNKLTWTLYSDGLLEIGGTGAADGSDAGLTLETVKNAGYLVLELNERCDEAYIKFGFQSNLSRRIGFEYAGGVSADGKMIVIDLAYDDRWADNVANADVSRVAIEAQVWADGLIDLKNAYLTDSLESLERIEVTVEVDNNTHGDFKTRKNEIKAVGAGFSTEETTLDLSFTKPDKDLVDVLNERNVDSKFKQNEAVQLEITLTAGGVDIHELNVPVIITIPIPSGIKPNNFWILHLLNDGSVEYIKPVVDLNGMTCTFKVSSFSDFYLTYTNEVMYEVVYWADAIGTGGRRLGAQRPDEPNFIPDDRLTPANVTSDLGDGWLNAKKPPKEDGNYGVALVSYPTLSGDSPDKNVVKVLYMPVNN